MKPMERKILYLVNPISGTKRKTTLASTIHKRSKEERLNYEIQSTQKDGNYSFLPDKINRDKITDVVVCGGDGSVSTVTSWLLNTDVSIGIIPTGSGNGLALAAGIPYSTKRALDIIFKGYSSAIDGFMINNKFSCMMCGIGSDAQVAHDFASTKVRGLKTYLKISALNYFKSRPFSFTLKTATKNITVDAFFITIANSNQFGNNVTIAPRASLNDGLLDFVIVKKMHKLILPFALLNQIAGINTITELNNYRNNKNIIYFQEQEAVIINHDKAPVHIDGEPEPETDKIHVRILPNAFRLLQPSL
jgi:diacylglycerol kinase (ATP)